MKKINPIHLKGWLDGFLKKPDGSILNPTNEEDVLECLANNYKLANKKDGYLTINGWINKTLHFLEEIECKQNQTPYDEDIVLIQFIKEALVKFNTYQLESKKKIEKEIKYAKSDHRVYALKTLCPDLFDSLVKLNSKKELSTEEIGKVLSSILNINPDDARKKGLGHKSLNVDGEFKDKIDELKGKIEKMKGEK